MSELKSTEEELNDMLREHRLDVQFEEDMSRWLHFHPEDCVADPAEMPTYSYFHPETWDQWIKP